MKKDVSKALNALGVLTIIFGLAAGIVVCVTRTTITTRGVYYTVTEEWSPIGLAWLAGIWFGSIVSGAVLMWMSEMLDEQRAQTSFLKKIYQIVNPNKEANEWSVGDEVTHPEYGTGKIERITESGEMQISFDNYGIIFLNRSDAKNNLKKI